MDEIENTPIGTLMEPDPIGFSFGAPGWTMLLGLVVLAALIFLGFRYLRYRRNKYRRTAVEMIEALSTMGLPVHQHIFKITETMKRVSISSYERSELAHLQGAQWVNYLEQKNKSQAIFTPRSKEIITDALYQGKKANLSEEEVKSLQIESVNWIKNHRV